MVQSHCSPMSILDVQHCICCKHLEDCISVVVSNCQSILVETIELYGDGNNLVVHKFEWLDMSQGILLLGQDKDRRDNGIFLLIRVQHPTYHVLNIVREVVSTFKARRLI